MTLFIKAPLAAFTAEPGAAAGGIVVDDGVVAELVPAGGTPETPVTTVFDASDHVMVPGLINTHHHYYQTLTRAFPPALGKELFDWLTALYPVWARLDAEALETATMLAMAELLLSGCTTSVDHHYVFPAGLEDAIDIQAGVSRRLGMRAVLTRGSMNLSVADGGLPPDSVVQSHDVILEDSERLISTHHETGPGAMVQIALAPCSPFSVTRELMRDTAALAHETGVRLHTHLAETEDENRFCQEKFNCRPLDYLEDCGWLTDGVWLAHGIHFNAAEIARLGAAGVGIAHCPGSNMILSSGFCPTMALEAAGAPVGLAVDGSASHDSSNMMQEVRLAFQLNRLRHGTEVGHLDALRWATAGSADCLGRGDLGRIAVGAAADLAFFKLDDLRFSGHGDPLAALVLCGAHQADRVMIGGSWAVTDGAVPGLDVSGLRARHQAAARRVQGR